MLIFDRLKKGFIFLGRISNSTILWLFHCYNEPPARVGGHIELSDVQSDLNYHGASPLLVSIVDDS